MMPDWQAYSETWMQRMMQELGNELGAVVAWNTNGATSWRNKIRAVSLSSNSRIVHYHEKLRHKLLRNRKGFAERTLYKELKRRGINRVLCNYGEFAVKFMSVWTETDVPLYVHFHGYDATFDLRLADQPDKKYFPDSYLNNLLLLSNRAKFIANSEFTKSLLSNAGIPSHKIFVKHLGVPVSPVCRKLHLPKRIKILHLGRLVDFKSPDRTIKAFEIACDIGLDGELIIAGAGPMRVTCELLRLRSHYKDSIHIIGAVSSNHARELLANSDIFTQHNIKGEITRQTECFGVSIIEAMAEGLPVVGTRCGGVVETVVDGKTGILVDPGDIEGQANALYQLATNPALRQELGLAGHRRVLDNFTMQHEAQKLREIMAL